MEEVKIKMKRVTDISIDREKRIKRKIESD